MPNILEVIRDLKALQGKEAAGTATAADLARMAELKAFMSGQKKPDPAPAGPPIARPVTAASGAVPRGSGPGAQPPSRTAAPAAKPVAPATPAKPAAAADPPPRPSRPIPAGQPDENAFSLSLDDDLLNELGEVVEGEDASRLKATTHAAADLELSNPFAINLDQAGLADDGPDESDAARTTFEVEAEPSVNRLEGSNPFALEVPDDVAGVDLPEDNQGGVTHELAEDELDDAAEEDDPFKVKLKQDFAKVLEKADPAKTGTAVPGGPKGTPMVPDSHYEKITGLDTSCVVQLRDGRLAKGVASAFSLAAPAFTLNQLVPGTKPISIKLEDCLTVRFVRAYNAAASCATPFPAKPQPTGGDRVTVKLLDGETLIGAALPHKQGENFILMPAVGGSNVKRIWVCAKAVRTYTKA